MLSAPRYNVGACWMCVSLLFWLFPSMVLCSWYQSEIGTRREMEVQKGGSYCRRPADGAFWMHASERGPTSKVGKLGRHEDPGRSSATGSLAVTRVGGAAWPLTTRHSFTAYITPVPCICQLTQLSLSLSSMYICTYITCKQAHDGRHRFTSRHTEYAVSI